jgi:hypothetical protein
VIPPARSPIEPGTFTFTPRELQRLAIYRAAVVAHFYTDQCDAVDPAEWARAYDMVLSSRTREDTNSYASSSPR